MEKVRDRASKGAKVFFFIAALCFYLSLSSLFTDDELSDFTLIRLQVKSAGFESSTKRIRSTKYYDFAIYGQTSRYYLSDPDLDQLQTLVPYIAKNDTIELRITGTGEPGGNYPIVQISKKGNVRYSLSDHKYRNEQRDFLILVTATLSLLLGIVFFFVSRKETNS